jgi:hypothetical protein
MTKRTPFFIVALCVLAASTSAQQPGFTDAGLLAQTRIDQTVQVRVKDGRSASLRVRLQNWSVRATSKPQRWPERGFLVFELLAGSLRSTIDGKDEERKEGDFWAVSEQSMMDFTVIGEMVTLQVLTIERR